MLAFELAEYRLAITAAALVEESALGRGVTNTLLKMQSGNSWQRDSMGLVRLTSRL